MEGLGGGGGGGRGGLTVVDDAVVLSKIVCLRKTLATVSATVWRCCCCRVHVLELFEVGLVIFCVKVQLVRVHSCVSGESVVWHVIVHLRHWNGWEFGD